MIRMSLDKETVLSCEVSPSFPAAISLSEQPQLAKTRPLRAKNGLQLPGNSQTSLASAPPAQRIAKRRYSMGVSFKGLAKRRRRAISDSQSEPVLPSHFLLGGNIFDPLNLNSLLDEDINRATNQETPKCSPLPSRGGDPVEILVPRDITDPLNLKGGGRDGKGGGVLLSPLKSRRRHRNRHHGGGGGAGGGGGGAGGAGGGVGGAGGGGEREVVPARLFPSSGGLTVPLLTREGSVSASPLPCELNTAITCRDDIAPPPILPRRHTHPPPGHKPGNQGEGRHRRRRRTASANINTTATTTQPTRFQTPLVGGAKAGRCGGPRLGSAQPPEKKKDKHRFQHGNHSCHYGYHGFYGDVWEGRVGAEEDPRLRLLEADWFRDKKVLDVGCGAGHLTLAVARSFNPAHILGVELDQRLVHAARQNVRHFLSHDLVVEDRRRRRGALGPPTSPPRRREEEVQEEVQLALSFLSLPLSFRVSRGPLSAPPVSAPPVSAPPVSAPPVSAPPVSAPPVSAPPVSAPPLFVPPLSAPPVSTPPLSAPPLFVPPLSAPPVSAPPVSTPPLSAPPVSTPPLSAPALSAPPLSAPPLSAPPLSAPPLSAPPLSAPPLSAPLSAPPLLLLPSSSSSSRFPNNITFIQGDYLSGQGAWPGWGQYDIIMCLGVTKWVHLQSGDGGVVTLFRRAYQSLSPGGLFILEPQPWRSYRRSKRASETTYRNFRSLRLRPEQFTCYLTDSVGFTSYRLITHTGNQRPIYLFHKGPVQRK